jgi:hypothetical protein
MLRQQQRFLPEQLQQQGWNSRPNLTFDQPQGGNGFNNNGNNFSNQPSIKDLVLGQVKINEDISKKFLTTNKS